MDGRKGVAGLFGKELARQVSIVLTERCDVGNLMVSELVGLGRSPYTGFWGSLSKDDETIVAKAMEQVGISFWQGG